MRRVLLVAIASLFLVVGSKAQNQFYSNLPPIDSITRGSDLAGPAVRNYSYNTVGIPSDFTGGTVANFTSLVKGVVYRNQLVFANRNATGGLSPLRFGHQEGSDQLVVWRSLWDDMNLNNATTDFKAKNIIAYGNVGIGTANPKTKLEVRSDVYYDWGWASRVSASNATADKQVFLGTFNTGQAVVGAHNFALSEWRDLYVNCVTPNVGANVIFGRNVGIGTATPREMLDIWKGALVVTGTDVNGTAFVTSKAGTAYFGNNSYNNGIAVASNGYVGIGTTNPEYNLDVLGTIRAKEIIVNELGRADFVFAPTYKLKPLAEVEAFVKENKHLPEIPSAAEVAEKGVNLGDMQNKLLQKVEELTLYVIEQQKQIEELKKIVAEDKLVRK